MKLQEIFNKAYVGIVKQGIPGHNGSVCVYHGVTEGGKEVRCAVGQLLEPDDIKYVGSLSSAVDVIFPRLELDPDRYGATNVGSFHAFLMRMQDAHDHAYRDARFANSRVAHPARFLELFKANMTGLAEHYGLTVPTID